jgi:hypothetical protein
MLRGECGAYVVLNQYGRQARVQLNAAHILRRQYVLKHHYVESLTPGQALQKPAHGFAAELLHKHRTSIRE